MALSPILDHQNGNQAQVPDKLVILDDDITIVARKHKSYVCEHMKLFCAPIAVDASEYIAVDDGALRPLNKNSTQPL